MSGFDGPALGTAIARVRKRMAVLEPMLNEADSRLGDGDTGVMLARVFEALFALDYTGGDIGATLAAMARKTASATGSSLGTLIATGLLAASKDLRGRPEIAFTELGPILSVALEAMRMRGGADLGDKTVLDSVDALVRALAARPEGGDLPAIAVKATGDALDAFREQACRRGRARMYAEKSVGIDDPGMLAFSEIVRAMAG